MSQNKKQKGKKLAQAHERLDGSQILGPLLALWFLSKISNGGMCRGVWGMADTAEG